MSIWISIPYPSVFVSYIYIYIYPNPLLGQDMTQGQFLAEFNLFDFRVFLLLD